MREYTYISNVDILSISISIRNISFSTKEMEIINFSKNLIRGGTPPSIAIESITVVICFFVICLFIFLGIKLIIIPTIMV